MPPASTSWKLAGVRRMASLSSPYVDHFPFAYELGIFFHQKCKARKLGGDGEIGVDNVAVDRSSVPLAEHTRRDVDRHHRGTALIDILNERFESTRKTIAEARTEETIYHKIASVEIRQGKGSGHFDQISPRVES